MDLCTFAGKCTPIAEVKLSIYLENNTGVSASKP